MSKIPMLGALCGVLIAFSIASYAAPNLWVSDSSGRLATVDVATGDVNVIGVMDDAMTDIAFDPSGNLWGITYNNLYFIDKTTAASTLIGSTGISSNSLVFGSDGTLYTANNSLWSISTSRGSATLVGNGGDQYNSSGDLAFVGGELLLSSAGLEDHLIELNTRDGSGALIGGIGFSRVYGLASPNGTDLYGVTGTEVVSINPTTGLGTSILNYAWKGLGSAWGAAFFSEADVPNPTLVDLDGTIETVDGSNICAIVLASGQFTFSCNPPGAFSLHNLTRESNGTVKRQIYADGFFPKVDVLSDSVSEEVVMQYSGACPNYNTPSYPSIYPGSAGKQIHVSGKILQQYSQTPVCAMVLANGQHTFSCDGTGNYKLNIPLNTNGQFKLQVYAEGYAPIVQTFDEFQTLNDVRIARGQECQASISLSAAVDSFVQSTTGKCIDMDGVYGCQCVDLMHNYIEEVLGIPRSDHSIRGSAYDIYSDLGDSTILTSGSQTVRLDKISITPTGVPKKGDIIFWTSNVGGGYGHVAIFISGDVNSFTSLDQNWLNSDLNYGSPAAVVNHSSYTNVAGWLRPVIISGSPN